MRNRIPRIVIDVVIREAKTLADRRIEIVRIDRRVQFVGGDRLIEQVEIDDGAIRVSAAPGRIRNARPGLGTNVSIQRAFANCDSYGATFRTHYASIRVNFFHKRFVHNSDLLVLVFVRVTVRFKISNHSLAEQMEFALPSCEV